MSGQTSAIAAESGKSYFESDQISAVPNGHDVRRLKLAKKSVLRGIAAGAAGGILAGWMMNAWSEGLGAFLSARIETPQDKERLKRSYDGEDATEKTAEKLSEIVAGTTLTQEQRQRYGPVVHYGYAVSVGALYGGLAERSSLVRTGFGTGFASVLFLFGDVLAVPALGLSKPLTDYPLDSYASPFVGHLVFGITTEAVRRLLRTCP